MLSALRAGWWLIALGVVVAGVVALAVSLLSTPLYTAHAQLFVSTTNAVSSQEIFQGGQFSQQRVTSYAELLDGEELAARVVDRLELQTSPSDLTGQITATASPETVLLDVAVTDPSPVRARDIVAALGDEFIDLVAELETPESGGPSPVKVSMFDAPEVPGSPSSPQSERNVALGVMAGLLIGAAVAVARARLDRSVKDADEAADLADAPVIGTVLKDPHLERVHVVEGTSAGRTAEDFRQLRANLQFLDVDEPPKVIMISSAVPSEGKTTVVVNLALALADAGRTVTIVEADLRRPKVTRYLGLVGGAGLTNVLAGTAELEEVLQTHKSGL
jgi:capsular polysaccharide biosynthesis protein